MCVLRMWVAILAIVLVGQGASLCSQGAVAADYPVTAAAIAAPREGDVVLRDFKFRSGESLPELRIHYHAFGQPKRDSHGVVRNAVLIVHGTGGKWR
jgi:homoserine O-acetyltransferase